MPSSSRRGVFLYRKYMSSSPSPMQLKRLLSLTCVKTIEILTFFIEIKFPGGMVSKSSLRCKFLAKAAPAPLLTVIHLESEYVYISCLAMIVSLSSPILSRLGREA